MNNNKLQKGSSIFIAAVLVAGVIAIASPMTAFAQEYNGNEKKYKSYDSYKPDKKYDSDPYKPDKKYDSDPYKPDKKPEFYPMKPDHKFSKANTHKAFCTNANVNINAFEQFQGEFGPAVTELLNEAASQPQDSTEAQGGANGLMSGGDGDALINVEGNVLNVCVKALNANTPIVTPVQTETDIG
jgi:hypothetical protein